MGVNRVAHFRREVSLKMHRARTTIARAPALLVMTHGTGVFASTVQDVCLLCSHRRELAVDCATLLAGVTHGGAEDGAGV